MSNVNLNRWVAFPVASLAAVVIGIAAVEAAPSPSPSASGSTSKNYAQVFVDKLAGILHLTPTQTQDALKQAEKQTVDQMLADGKITKAQADAMKARIDAGQGLGPVGGFGFKHGGFGADRTLMRDLSTAEMNAVASALKMSPADLKSALRSGKTLSQLETQQGVSDSAVKTAVKNAAKGVLDKAVKAKTITQAQEDAILAHIDAGGFGFGHKRFHSEQPEPGQSPSQSPASPSQSPAPTPAAYYSTI